MSCRLMKQTKCLINKSFVTYGQFYSRQNASVEVKNFSSSSRLSIFNQRRPNKVIDGKNDEDDEDFMFSVKGMQQEDDQEEADLNSAYKAAIKMRSEKQEKKEQNEVDQYKNILQFYEASNLSNLAGEKLAKVIRKHVIYADKKLVVFNKPYGVASHDGDKVKNNIKEVLPIVSKMLYGIRTNVPLTLCHRLETQVTGAMVCCSDPERAKELYSLFRKQKILKCFWAITLSRPHPRVGKLEIPLIRSQAASSQSQRGHIRTKCSPFVRYDENLGREVRRKVFKGTPSTTYYRTLSNTNHASLIEFQPRSNFKHQVRAHAAEGLACPILGDHKYSNSELLRPQYLSKYMLDALKVTKSKTRYLPLHLHLRRVLIPDVSGSKDKPHLSIIAKVPAYFERSLKVLRLRQNLRLVNEWHGLDEVEEAPPQHTEHSELYVDPSEANSPSSDKSSLNNIVNVYNPHIKVKYRE